MGYNRQKIKMKKFLISATLFIGMVTVAMVFSSFTTTKENVKSASSQIEMNDGDWKVIRENVAYCTSRKACAGYGKVWVNRETYQIAFQPSGSSSKYDLGECTDVEGYNMCFYYQRAYYYVNIYVPSAAFDF